MRCALHEPYPGTPHASPPRRDSGDSSQRHHSKHVSYAVWYPALARAHVTTACGVHFTSMGRSVARSSTPEKKSKRLELLQEGALYLVEKGALFCWKELAGAEAGVESIDD